MNLNNQEIINKKLPRFEQDEHILEMELHKLLSEETHQSHHELNHEKDVLGEAIEKAMAEMDFPELLDQHSHSTENVTRDPQNNDLLTVESILENDTLITTNDNTVTNLAVISQDPINKKLGTVYETLSPESLSPFSDNNDLPIKNDLMKYVNEKNNSSQIKNKRGRPTTSPQRVCKDVPLPSKLTNEFTMMQVSEIKKRIFNTHKLMLNFNFLKDGYTRSCSELKKTINKLKESEYHRANLIRENENLKSLVLELTGALKNQS